MTLLECFLSLKDFDDYMAHYEFLCGLTMDVRTFRKEQELMGTDGTHTHREKESIREKKRRAHLKKLKSEIETLKVEISECGVWINPIEESEIELLYQYPHDRRGDVDHCIAGMYYEPEQITKDTYAVTIPAEDLDIIELLAFSGRRLFMECNENDSTVAFLLRYNRIAQIEHLMCQVNYYKEEYRNLRTIPDIELRKLLQAYHNGINACRDKIYEELVIERQTNSRWVSEQEAYRIVKAHYPDAKFQYQADFLRGQRLDIFIPSQSTAIEYQGKQHYEPVEFFGGKAGHRSNQTRDERKRKRCKENGIQIIYWDYDKPLTDEYFVRELIPKIVR